MDADDLLKSGMGAIIGFSLAQMVNLAKVIWNWWRRPKLHIETQNDWVLLSHTTEIGKGEYAKEEIYGFQLRNGGRSIASNVRVQLIKIEHQSSSESRFRTISEHAHDLPLYLHASRDSEVSKPIVLVPGASANVQLASYREDYDVIFPSVSRLPEYYEETCLLSSKYRFTVAAFDDKAHSIQKTIDIDW